ncbi:MAG: efflux RND transporter periplasmic adaptor subunit [Rubripirellula sp.]
MNLPRSKNRFGSIESSLVIGFVAIAVIGCISHFIVGSVNTTFGGFFDDTPEVDFLTASPFQGPFIHTVLERGEVESSSNVEVRCQVKSRSSVGTNILEIVPEGSWVEEGDFLVRFDDAYLQTQLIQQQITCSNSESAFIEATATLESAKLTLDEYSEGTFKEQLAQQQSAVFVAEENNRRAEEYVQYSKRLAERGYIPEAQLEADIFALEKSKQELGVAETKLNVLNKYTRQKMLTQLRANVKTSEAKLQSRQKTWELDKVQLQEITEQIEKCVIHAPVAGQVVYQNNRGRSSSVIIEEGMPVRERQTIINLPDPKKMRVVAKVHESRIGFVQKGQPAELRLDSMPELPLDGKVTEVSEYPLPAISVYMAHVKEYAVEIEILNPPGDLRPGMTAEVNVLVEQTVDALQIPIEAVVERDERFFCAIALEEGKLETRELKVGSANETDLVILSGLGINEEVVLNISDEKVLELMELPEEES